MKSTLFLSLLSFFVWNQTTFAQASLEIASPRSIARTESLLDQICMSFEGYFSNKDYVSTVLNAPELSQDIIGRRIWRDKWTENKGWVYFGWFKTDMYDFPLLETIVEIEVINENEARFKLFYLPDSVRKEHEWLKAAPYAGKTTESLIYFEGCSNIIHRDSSARTKLFVRQSEQLCKFPSDSAIKWARFQFDLDPEHIIFNNILFDEQQQPVVRQSKAHFKRMNFRTLQRKI